MGQLWPDRRIIFINRPSDSGLLPGTLGLRGPDDIRVAVLQSVELEMGPRGRRRFDRLLGGTIKDVTAEATGTVAA